MGGGEGLHGTFDGTIGARRSASIQQDRQNKHIVGTKNYLQEIAQGRHPSILTTDAMVLLREGAGTGVMRGKRKRETVDYGRIIGKWYDRKTKAYSDTTRATIHYDSKGNAHIVPSIPKELLPKRGRKK